MGLRRDLETLWLQEVPERIEGVLDKHGIPEGVRNDLVEQLLGIVPHKRAVEKSRLNKPPVREM